MGATETTYRQERWRAVSSGIIETAASTFLLLIAVRHYEAGATAKALIASGASVGLLISPWIVAFVETKGWRTSQAAAGMMVIGCCSFLLSAAVPYLPVFIITSVLAMASSAGAIPLMTQIYQENYPSDKRGMLFSRTFIIRIATAALFSEFAGRFLSVHLGWYRALLVLFAVAFAWAAFCLRRVPSTALVSAGGTHPFRSLKYAQIDPLFRHTLICWMLLGFANLMMVPLRVEYLANPQHGLNLDVATIALLTGVVPNAARLVLSPIWGWLFDKMNFFLLRATLNMGFAIAILTFFTSDSLDGLVLAAVIFGISNAGGDVAWSLWVTKFAPPARVADYMAVHTFFTGLRGVIAPLVAFHMVTKFSLTAMGWASAIMITISAAMLLPEVKFGRRARSEAPLVEEISE